MRGVSPRAVAGLIACVLSFAMPLCCQQGPDEFRWVDFHSDSDHDTVVWVTRSLEPQKWTAIREIGVEYDAALVVTTLRASPQSPASEDTFTVWNASLTTHAIAPLIKGVNLRWLDWMHFLEGARPEPAALYDSCNECAANTFFTAFYYDISQHMWTGRWLQNGQGVQVWGGNPPEGVTENQAYAILTDFNGAQFVSTWTHLDYGKQKPQEDFIYRHELDQFSRLERTQPLSGKSAEAMKQRICHAPTVVPGLARGQDSPLCEEKVKPRQERKPVTTPPANNRGQSVPPGARH